MRRPAMLSLAAFVAIIIVGTVIYSTYRNVFSLIVYGLIVLGGLFVLVNWHARTFACRCVDCDHVFRNLRLEGFGQPTWSG